MYKETLKKIPLDDLWELIDRWEKEFDSFEEKLCFPPESFKDEKEKVFLSGRSRQSVKMILDLVNLLTGR